MLGTVDGVEETKGNMAANVPSRVFKWVRHESASALLKHGQGPLRAGTWGGRAFEKRRQES